MSKISKLEENPRAVLDPYITALQSESKIDRKRAMMKIREEIFMNPVNAECDLSVVFPQVDQYILKCFSDPSEGCREVAICTIMQFVNLLPLSDYYLTYIVPVIVRRIGCPEIVEESEEIRLLLIHLVHQILEKYKDTRLLSPFINDFTSILTKTCTDPFPKVKLDACQSIILLSTQVEKEFHFQSESFIKPLLSNFSHQHFRVRAASLRAVGATVLSGNVKCFEMAITPFGEKLFDEHIQVRLQVILEVANWMLSYKDRYSFWHRMIPLLLTGLSDSFEDIRNASIHLWNDIGLKYMDENEEDLKKRADFLRDPPTHYPDLKRPNLGCRALVQNNIGKIVPAIAKEMDGWQADSRLRVAQLLCWLIVCAEEGSTQHASTVVRVLYRGASDDDSRVVLEIKRASELLGYFIDPATWWPLLEAEVDSWGALFVIAHILRGARKELVAPKVMRELCDELADPDRCRVRKHKYQYNMMLVVESLMNLCDEACTAVAEQLFIINFTVYAMPIDETIQRMALANLVKLREIENCGMYLDSLFKRHVRRVLTDITSDAVTWTLVTPERCLLEAVLLYAGTALGTQLHLIAPLLKECLATPAVDPEVKLKVFMALSSMLLRRQISLRRTEPYKLQCFLKIILQEVIIPNLVWEPGRTAESIRTAAVACLCSALQEDPFECVGAQKTGDASADNAKKGGEEKSENEVDNGAEMQKGEEVKKGEEAEKADEPEKGGEVKKEIDVEKENEVEKGGEMKKEIDVEKEDEVENGGEMKKEIDVEKKDEVEKGGEMKKEIEVEKEDEVENGGEMKKKIEVVREAEVENGGEMKKEIEIEKEDEVEKGGEMTKRGEAAKGSEGENGGDGDEGSEGESGGDGDEGSEGESGGDGDEGSEGESGGDGDEGSDAEEVEVQKKGDGDSEDKRVNLFPNKESLEPFLEELVPLLLGLVDDNSALTRQHALRAACSLAALARSRGCFTADILHKLSFAVLKRLDDSNDRVRSSAVQTVRVLFQNRMEGYDAGVFQAHVDALYGALLVHLDDVDEAFRDEALDVLLSLSKVDPKLLMKKVNANIHLYRNKEAYEKLSNHLEKLLA